MNKHLKIVFDYISFKKFFSFLIKKNNKTIIFIFQTFLLLKKKKTLKTLHFDLNSNAYFDKNKNVHSGEQTFINKNMERILQ